MGKYSMLKKSSMYFIVNLSSKFMSSILVPLYAFYISTEELGYYDYTQTIMNIIVPFAYVAVWEAILRYILLENDEVQKDRLIASSSLFAIIISLILCVCLYFCNYILKPNIMYVNYVIFMVVAYSITNIWQYYARALGENKIYVIAGIMGAFFYSVVSAFLILALSGGIKVLYISYIISHLIMFFFIEYKLRILSKIKLKNLNLRLIKQMLKYSFPLVLNLASLWMITGFGKFLIINKLGVDINGLYAFANKFSIIVSMTGSVVSMALIEESIILAKTKGMEKQLAGIINNIFNIFQSIIILSLPLVFCFYCLIINTAYYMSIEYIPWLLLYAVIMTMSTNIGSVFQALNKTKYLFTTTVIGAILTVSISCSLISILNIYAILLGQNVGALAMMILRYFLANRFVVFKIAWRPILIMFMFYVINWVVYSHLSLIFVIIMFIISLMVLLIYNKVQINILYKKTLSAFVRLH